MKSKKRATNDPVRIRKIQGFISDSTLDYISSRVLFNNSLPAQAAILASTAIEKALKAYLAFNGNESHGHLKKAHWAALQNFDRKLYSALSNDFLLLNQKVYKLRYTDDLTHGYNVVIATNEYLAELDFTILTLLNQFVMHTGNPEDYRPNRLETMIKGNDPRLWSRNHFLMGVDKERFIYSSHQLVYELRNHKGEIIEVNYATNKKPFNSSFLREGFVNQNGDDRTFKMSFDR